MPVPILPSQLTLLLSPMIYIGLFHLLTIFRLPSPTHLVQSREVLSIIHCALITLLSLLALYHHRPFIYPAPESLAHFGTRHGFNSDGLLPIISTKSSACNSLTALETGYLVADTVILLLISSAYRRSSDRATTITSNNGCISGSTGTIEKSGINPTMHNNARTKTDSTSPGFSRSIHKQHHQHHQNRENHLRASSTNNCNCNSNRHTPPASPSFEPSTPSTTKLKIIPLLIHHTLLVPPLLVLQLYITLHLERGILILTAFLLMNASSPLSSLRWWLLNFQSGGRRSGKIAVVSWIYWVVFGVCRVALIWWVLGVYGAQKLQRQHIVRTGRVGRFGGAGDGESSSFAGGGEDVVTLSVWRVFWGLGWPCVVGTAMLWGINVWWFGRGVWKMAWRSFRGEHM